MKSVPIIGITMGDPAGIGPEVVLKALTHRETAEACRCVVYGSIGVMQEAAELIGWDGRIVQLEHAASAEAEEHTLQVISCGEEHPYPKGEVSRQCGELAFQAVNRAAADAMGGIVEAVSTAPLNKESLRRAGYPWNGHTELFAELTGTEQYAMMLVEGNLRVVHVSTHVSLKQAISLVRTKRIVSVIRLVHDALCDMGIPSPRIAVAGLNPHAGEGGLFGEEEIREIIPAVKETADLGASGPYPPDTVFSRTMGGEFDAAAAMYHDQGHIALKTAGFKYERGGKVSISGVNITLGLPIIRTSADHGTAFDRAWKGTADERSMLSAVLSAAEMVKNRRSR